MAAERARIVSEAGLDGSLGSPLEPRHFAAENPDIRAAVGHGPELLRLAERYEDDLKAAVSRHSGGQRAHCYVYLEGAALGQVACALEDANFHEQSVRPYSPLPSDRQGSSYAVPNRSDDLGRSPRCLTSGNS